MRGLAGTGFRAGAATSVITPPLGRPIVGNFIAPLSTNVHDELHARCLVLDDGKTKLALVVVDLLGTEVGMCADARPDRKAAWDSSEQRADLRRAYPFCQQRRRQAPAPAEPEYETVHFVVQRIVDGVRCAANRLHRPSWRA